MSHRIQIVGYLDLPDTEYDDGPNGPFTEEAFEQYMDDFMGVGLDDLSFIEVI